MLRVLIVDDEPITRMDLAGMLEELSYEVVGEAGDGFDAVELCRMKHPDVVLMDVKMPIFDGLTASEKIIQEGLAGCVVLLTAFNDNEMIERAKSIGVSGYLVKPVEQRLLRPTIEVALAQSKRYEASRQETEKVKKKLNDTRLIASAQSILAQNEQISETEAYRKMRSVSMNKRISMAELAQAIIDQEQRSGNITFVRTHLMQRQHLSRTSADAKIEENAKAWNCTLSEAARRMRRELEGIR